MDKCCVYSKCFGVGLLSKEEGDKIGACKLIFIVIDPEGF
jgi:hypothetical protein